MSARPTLTAGSLALAVLLGACHDKPAPGPAPGPERAQPAEHWPVKLETVSDLKPVFATITTRNQGMAIARISGTLVSLTVKEGDQVRKGQIIARIKDDRLDLQAKAYDAQVAAAEAEAARAQADLGRIRTLYNSGIYAKARLEQSEAAAKTASANASAARAQAAASTALASQGAVLAPADGKVIHAALPVGTAVMAGQTVAEITAGQTIVRLELPEGQATSLKVGDKVALDAMADGAGQRQGTIIEVYPSVSDGQVTADAQVPGLSDALVGQRIRAYVRIGERQAIILPKRFITSRYGIDFVKIVLENGKPSEVTVQTAPYGTPDRMEVLSGLRPGDVIVPAGPSQ